MNDFAPAPEYARLAQAGITIRAVALAASHAGAQASTPSPASPPPAGRATADAENVNFLILTTFLSTYS